MKCQILFPGKNKKNNIILSSAGNAQRVVKVKYLLYFDRPYHLTRLAITTFLANSANNKLMILLLLFFFFFFFFFRKQAMTFHANCLHWR